MNDFTIAMYCFVDDCLQITGKKPAARRKLNDAEVIKTALLTARYFGGNMTRPAAICRSTTAARCRTRAN